MADIPWWADPDPWRLTPEEQAEADKKRAERIAAAEAIPDLPPF